jgi:hypothetical protein
MALVDGIVVPERSVDLLRRGGRAAVVGRGVGQVALRLAERCPLSSVHGFDGDASALEAARAAASAAGVAGRCHFAAATPDDVPAGGYALLVLLECLNGTVDARAVARRASKVIAIDGVVVAVERAGIGDPGSVRRVLSASGLSITEDSSGEDTHVIAAELGRAVR